MLLVSSGAAPNSDVPSLRTSTFKRYVKRLAMGGTGTLITTAVSIVHVPFVTSVLAGKPQPIPIDPFTDCYRFSCTFTVPLGRTQGISQAGNRAHDATTGGYLADTGEERTQDHVGRTGGHLVIVLIVSWSTMGGIIMIDGCLHHTIRWFPIASEIASEYTSVNVGSLLPSVRRLYHRVGGRAQAPR